MRIVAIGFIFLLFCLFSLLTFPFSYAKIIPRFPSSIIRPEQVSLSTENKLCKTKYFTQILDHFNFNPQCYQTFQQRYLINDTYWGGSKKNAPIFVYTGNEGDTEWFTQNTGFMFDNAPHFKALLVFIEMCKAIDDPTTGNDTFAKLYGAANVYYNTSGTTTCFNLNAYSDDHGVRLRGSGWTWQACTEMILPAGGNNEESIFPASKWSYNDRATLCKKIFDIEPRPNWITTGFGGHDIERVLKRFGSNIIFFKGLRDPWSGGGVLKNISKSIVAIVAEEGAHHVDLRFSTNEDPEWLKDVRKKEVKIIAKWISQYYNAWPIHLFSVCFSCTLDHHYSTRK